MDGQKDLGHKNNPAKNDGAGVSLCASLIAHLMIRPPWNASVAIVLYRAFQKKYKANV